MRVCGIALAVTLLFGCGQAAHCAATPVLPHQICQFIDAYPVGVMIGLNVACWKNHVYMSGQGTNGNAGPSLFKFNVIDPYNMLYVSAGDGSGIKGYDVKVVEDRLYEANWGTVLRIYDLCGVNPPKQLGEHNYGRYFGWTVDVVNRRAYVGVSYESSASEIFIYDISNPANPTLLAQLPNTQGRLGGSPKVRGSYMYYVNENHFCIANVSDAANPYKMTNIAHNYRLGGVRLRDKYAFVYWSQDGGGGIYVYDVTDPASPVRVGEWPEPPPPPAPPPSPSEFGTGLNDMTLLGDLAICATGGNGILSFSIADPTHPWPVSQPNYGNWYEMNTAANGCYAYAAMYRHVPDDRGGLLSLRVYSEDPDSAGPGKWSNFSLLDGSWDTDYEADALPTAASQPWKLFEGTESLASISGGVLDINDSSSSAKVKWIRNWDATSTDGATVVFRARCPSYDTTGGSLITLSNVFIEDGKYREEFAVLSDKIRAQNANVEYPLDGTQWHTYRITTQGTQFRVYVDEAPDPVMTFAPVASTERARVTFGSGSTLCKQHILFDYLECCSYGAFGPAALTADQTPDLTVSVADTAGKDSLSGINPATAQVHYSRDGGQTWITGGCTVTCTSAGCGTPPDRGVIKAFGVPFNQDSQTLNKVKFSLQDNVGNVGYSPVYSVRIDQSARPTITNVTSSTANGLYKQGGIVNIQVAFNGPVNVIGAPQMQLAVKPAGKLVNWVTGSGTSTLTFTYTVGADEATPDLSYTSSGAIVLNGGAIRDQFGSDADLRMPDPGAPGSLSDNKDITIDSVRPVAVNIASDTPDGSYRAGDEIDITVSFSETVNVTGTPQLTLETGAVDQKANYLSGSGQSTLTFRYTVQPGDASPDLDYKAANSLTGTIKDVAGNFANMTLPAPASAGSLGYNSSIVIDNTSPTVTEVGAPSIAITRDCPVSHAVTFSEPVVGFDSASDIQVNATGDATVGSVAITGSGAGPYAVTLSGFSGSGTIGISIAAGTCTDAAGNPVIAGPASTTFVVVPADGSIAAARLLGDTELVGLGDKALYLKQSGFSYIEEPDRSSGIRVQGVVSAAEGDLVTLTGVMRTTLAGERYIEVTQMASCSPASLRPVGACNGSVRLGLMDGLFVKVWGRVTGSVLPNEFAITDGSQGAALKIITVGAPGVNTGDFVTIEGAAGFEGERVIYRK